MSTTQTDMARWAMQGYLGQYPWDQCRYCGRAQSHDCEIGECPLCGTRQCRTKPDCAVCHYGWLPGWHRGGTAEARRCGYKQCENAAVASAPRVKRVCAEHAPKVKIRWAGETKTLAEYAAARVAHRDSGRGWECWKWVA